jgi:hypothetical protein
MPVPALHHLALDLEAGGRLACGFGKIDGRMAKFLMVW